MAKLTSKYLGNLRTETVHPSGNTLITDAPTDNNGKGAFFSPTDLVATALSTCMMTLMGIWADRKGVSLEGVTWETVKIMADKPRRIDEVQVTFYFPKALNLEEEAQEALKKYALNCPVARSVHPDLKLNTTFVFDHE